MQETKRRLRVSPSLVISIFALVIAMSAGAYAATIAPKNSVVSKSIKNGEVKARHQARRQGQAAQGRQVRAPRSPTAGRPADIGDGQVSGIGDLCLNDHKPPRPTSTTQPLSAV